ncbi:MAG: PHP domain-containing protein [Planctomycetes bacterium]|nr:PHP domain-containing protein [Planctomycetota bacterium]
MKTLKPPALAALLVTLAFADPGRPEPVVLDAACRHVGDNSSKGFTPADPGGPEWSAVVPKLPALPDRCLWGLTARVRHVVDSNHRAYEKGGFVDEVRLDGVRVAALNDFVDAENGPAHEVWVPLVGVALKPGSKLSIVAGKDPDSANLDDFEVENLRLAPMRRVAVRTGGPAKIVVAGAPRLGPDYESEGASRAVFSPDGEAELILPADGTYKLTVSRGPEFEVAVAELAPWATAPLDLVPKRAFDTPGMVGADFHLHADPSGDSRVKLQDRVASYLAEGIEYVVATDHNHATDYRPAIAELKAGHLIRSSVGDEITSSKPRIGHFNVFPIDQAVDASGLTPKILLERVDARSPRARRVLQVNHPRDGDIGYFNVFKLDPATAKSPVEGFSLEFDAIEVFNGKSDWKQLEACLRDWYGLLNAGFRITATGNSDSHRLVLEEAGWPRNYVIVGKEGLPSEEEVVAAVCAHRVVVSAGPVLEIVDAAGRSVVGEELKGASVEVTVRLRAPSWAQAIRIVVIADGKPLRTLEPAAEQKLTLSENDGSWFVFVAEGERFTADVVTHARIRPWGFTNPIWLRRS